MELEIGENMESESIKNLSVLLKEVSESLKDPSKSDDLRSTAANVLVNAVFSNDESIKLQYQDRWSQIPEDTREYIKINCMESLSIKNDAAKCVAYIACAELPRGLWPDCITRLIINVTDANTTEVLKESSLEAICYICKEIYPEFLKKEINELLIFFFNLFPIQMNESMKRIFLNILKNIPALSKVYFYDEICANLLMQIVCESLEQSTSDEMKIVGLKAFNSIIIDFYEYHVISCYMGKYLANQMIEAINSQNARLALESIHFWINLCHLEANVETSKSKNYISDNLQNIVPALLNRLTIENDCDNEEEWSIYKALCLFLMLLANCVDEAILPLVLPFINDNIKNENVQSCDLALIALGSIVKMKNNEACRDIINEILGVINELSAEPVYDIRVTLEALVYLISETFPEIKNEFTLVSNIEVKKFKFLILNSDLTYLKIKFNEYMEKQSEIVLPPSPNNANEIIENTEVSVENVEQNETNVSSINGTEQESERVQNEPQEQETQQEEPIQEQVPEPEQVQEEKAAEIENSKQIVEEKPRRHSNTPLLINIDDIKNAKNCLRKIPVNKNIILDVDNNSESDLPKLEPEKPVRVYTDSGFVITTNVQPNKLGNKVEIHEKVKEASEKTEINNKDAKEKVESKRSSISSTNSELINKSLNKLDLRSDEQPEQHAFLLVKLRHVETNYYHNENQN